MLAVLSKVCFPVSFVFGVGERLESLANLLTQMGGRLEFPTRLSWGASAPDRELQFDSIYGDISLFLGDSIWVASSCDSAFHSANAIGSGEIDPSPS